MKLEAFLGIDPGVNGACALIYDGAYLVHDYESPERSWEVLSNWNDEYDIKFACLELILIYPYQKKGHIQYRSGNAINKLPQNMGQWRMALIALGIDIKSAFIGAEICFAISKELPVPEK